MGELEGGATDNAPTRWPGVVGLIGIIAAVLMFVDKVDDLFVAWAMSPEAWSKLVGPETAEMVDRLMPPMAWLVLSALIGGGLAVMLLLGSLRLRKRRQSGVELCRKWSQLAIVWAVVEVAFGIWWLRSNAEYITELASAPWQAPSALGLLVALAIMMAFPIFLLIWLSKPEVEAEYASWQLD